MSDPQKTLQAKSITPKDSHTIVRGITWPKEWRGVPSSQIEGNYVGFDTDDDYIEGTVVQASGTRAHIVTDDPSVEVSS